MSIGILASFHYWRRHSFDVLGDWRPLTFADSGAFSAFNAGAAIDVHEYAAWLDKHRDHIDLACTLDVIGDAEATAANTAVLEDHGHTVVPVFHVGEPWEWLDRYCEGYPFVALGGMVGHAHRQKALLRWLVACMLRGRVHGTQFHGFGITSMNSVAQLPLFSIDSTTWKNGVRFGELPLWDDLRGMVRIQAGRRRAEIDLIQSYGLPAAEILGTHYALRCEGKSDERYRFEYDELKRVVLESWVRFEAWWHARHAPISVPGQPDGPHVFLALTDADIPAAKAANHVKEDT